MKVILDLDDEKERVLTSSLNLYKKMVEESLNGSPIQKEISRYEVKLVHQLLTQVSVAHNLRAMLPTISDNPKKQAHDCSEHLDDLCQGKIGSLSVITDKGSLWQIIYDTEDQSFRLLKDNQILLQTQQKDLITRLFRSLNS